jgi:hypothetical protein
MELTMKLNIDRVLRIKELLSQKTLPQSEIARRHGVSRSMVSDIATGRAWTEVPWPSGEPCPKKPGGQHKPLADVDPTNERILELESEVVHLTEERNREKAKVKAGAKITGLFKAVVKEMDARIKPFKALPSAYRPDSKGQIVEHCVLHISDMHADAVVRPGEVGGMEEFNFPIACARAEHLVESVIDWTQSALAPRFNFPVLWVLVYGDLSSGTIHKAAERSYYRNQFKNSLAIGQLLGLMMRDLSSHFSSVNVVCVSGNHGRITPKKDYGGSQENFDYLIAEIARMHCKELMNTSWLLPDAWSVNLNINGVGMNVSHGDDVRSNGGLPWYAMQRRQKGLIAMNSVQGGLHTKYFAQGHHHAQGSLADMDGELLMNGAWIGTDQFAYNALAGFREPSQLLHGMNEKYGASWRLPIRLKTPGERGGPKRYLIDGGREVGPL